MADKELRRMNRTELIEIIYALEQNEKKLREENDKLNAELEDRSICLEQSGSIAEAALGLNHIFEDAQAAADQYLISLQSMEENPEETEEDRERIRDVDAEAEQVLTDAGRQRESILDDARKQADEIVENAGQEANDILATAREQAQVESQEILSETKKECDRERQAIQDYHDRFMRDMSDVLKDNPELLERVRQMGSMEGE